MIQGSVYDNLIVPGGGTDVITAGAGSNVISGGTAQLASITVTDFHLGDSIDFGDLNPAAASVKRSGDELLVFSSGVQVSPTSACRPTCHRPRCSRPAPTPAAARW